MVKYLASNCGLFNITRFINLFTATCFVSDKSMCPSSNLMTDDFSRDVKVNITSI